MEASREPISLRSGHINTRICGKLKTSEESLNVFTREGLLDALQVLYDECNAEYLKNTDKNVQTFVEKNRKTLCEIKQLRVNLADFEVKNVIGTGHFGEVFVIKEKQTGDIYAMKIIKKYESLEQKNCTFEIERNIMAFADSPWLTSLRYAFQDSINLYFVMEYHPGGDLLGLLYRQGGTLPESACTFYIAELVIALNDLHTMGYVHRDIKPENILLDRCGHLKIVDFGSATKLSPDGVMTDVLPVGTSDYIAPELLQSLDNKTKKVNYGVSCDYWSLGILAYELTIGNTPFNAQNTSLLYSKIMNHKNTLKFPPDVVLSQGFVSIIKGLLTDQNSRLTYKDIRKHPHFKNVDFDGLRDQVPPYVPKINSIDDTSNFTDVQRKKNEPHMDSFKKKTKFSGRNLPFIGFTYTAPRCNDYYRENPVASVAKDETLQSLKTEIDRLQQKLLKTENSFQKRNGLERKLEEEHRKLKNLESLRDQLEHDLANSIAECSGLKRRLEFERKDRSDLEQKALELIKSAKLKWESSEKTKLDALNKQINEYKENVLQIQNEKSVLKLQLDCAIKIENTHKASLDKMEGLNRQSVIGLESRLEKIISQSQNQIAEIQSKLNIELNAKLKLEKEVDKLRKAEKDSNFAASEKLNKLQKQLENLQDELKNKNEVIFKLEKNTCNINKFEAETAQLKDEIQALESCKKEKECCENKLKKETEVSTKMKQEIEDLQTEITFEKLAHKAIVEDLTLKYKSKIADLESTIKEKLNQSCELEIKLKEAELNDETNKAKVKTLEELLIQLEKGVSKLESSSEREPVLQEQVKRLEQQLGELHENLALEKQELLKLKSKYWRMEKDLQNAELDKKIVERDLKESKEQNNQLTVEMKNLNDNMRESKKKHERALLELNTLNENLTNEVYKLKDLIGNLEDKVHQEKEKFDGEKNCVVKLQDEANNKEKYMCSLIKELERYKTQLTEAERQIFTYEKNNGNLILRFESLMKEKSDLLSEIENYKQEQQNNQLNRIVLKDVCTILECQLEAYDNKYEASQTENAALKSEIEKLTNDLLKSKQDIVDARRMMNEEKSLKLLAETKCKRLQEDIESLRNEGDTYKNKCEEFKDYSKYLTTELNSAEQKITDLQMDLKSTERQMKNFMSENCLLKEENSLQITHVNNLNDSNYKLNQNLSEFKMNNQILMQKVNDVENNFLEKANYYRERELKYEATIQQQTKLIDFLQLKVEDANKKKKTLSGKLFGHSKKENQAPIPGILNYKDLEMQLNKEKEITKNLRQEIVKLKNEFASPGVTEIAMNSTLDVDERKKVFEQIVQSPSSQNNLLRQNSLQRMHHNIPHRFESKLCMKTTKCGQCNNQLVLGRNMSVCCECCITVHSDCVNILPRTCGLPQAYAKHYSDSLLKLENIKPNSTNAALNGDLIDIEGWVKVPKKGFWEKYYASLTPSALTVYKKPPNQANVEVVEFLALNQSDTKGKVILEPSNSEIDIPVANSDLPFVIKVEVTPNTTCWPPINLIFMTLSIEDKEKWYKALQKIFGGNTGKYTGEHLMKLEGELEVNCLVEANEVKLLGTEQGLYSYNKNGLLLIAGPLNVHQITLLPSVNLALMIADENRVLISCDIKHLLALAVCATCTKPTLIFKEVNVKNLSGFHIFQTSDFVKHKTLCIATARQLVIMNYDFTTQQFIAVRILDTAQPTSCILFTEHSLIIGADKYFEIDLRTYNADEFIDMSDIKLSLVTKCYKMKSFPIAILKISENPTEYLLCFNEFATFVDEFGQSTRSYDVKWTHLPHAFYYHKNYLYVCQFYAVEIIKIALDMWDDSNISTQDGFKIEIDNVKYLGHSKKGVFVKSGREIKYISYTGLESDDVSLNSETTDENDLANNSDRFSFTSSVMHSLDGNLSDAESVSSEGITQKRVKFARTTDL